MSHVSDVSERARLEIANIASKMISGEVDLLEGSRAILKLRSLAGDELNGNAAFEPLIAVESELDGYPLGEARSEWDSSTLDRMDKEKAEYLERVQRVLVDACADVIVAVRG